MLTAIASVAMWSNRSVIVGHYNWGHEYSRFKSSTGFRDAKAVLVPQKIGNQIQWNRDASI